MQRIAYTPRDGWQPLIADVVSWGWALAVLGVGLISDAALGMWQAVFCAVLFLTLRTVAREMHRSARRAQRQMLRRHDGRTVAVEVPGAR